MKKQLISPTTISTPTTNLSASSSSSAGAGRFVKRVAQAFVASATLFAGIGGVFSPAAPVSAAASSGPVRVVDTRVGSNPTIINGRAQGGRPVSGGDTITVHIGSDPVMLNTVAVLPTAAGFATIYPCADGLPNASNLNFVAGSIISNSAIATPDANGDACVYFEIVGGPNGVNKTDVVIDQYSTINADQFQGQTPVRLYDSRNQTSSPRPADSVSVVHVGVANQPVALNVTTTGSTGPGIFTVFPCGVAVPTTSNLNYETAETRAALAVVKTNSAGDLCIYTSTPSHIVADWAGTFTGDTTTQEFFTPTRLMDTRDHFGGNPGQHFLLNLTNYQSQTGQPVTANGRTVMLNITDVGPNSDGYITVYPCGNGTIPNASILNYPNNRYATANSVLIQPDSMNRVCFYSASPTQLVVDLFGYTQATSTPIPADPARPNPPTGTRTPIYSTLTCHPTPDAFTTANQWRANHSAAPLTYNQHLYNGAQWWAQQLIKTGEFRHTTREEVAAAGYGRRLAEVIGMRDTVTTFRNSLPHYQIITDPQYTQAAFAYCQMEYSNGATAQIITGWFDK